MVSPYKINLSVVKIQVNSNQRFMITIFCVFRPPALKIKQFSREFSFELIKETI